MTLVRNRLRLVTSSSDELRGAQTRLFNVANATRTEFQATSELYLRLAQNTRQLGLSQDELFAVVTSINQAVAISGATAQEASAGLIQLSQGLASGTLRGDELRSVLEQLPAVADVIARGLGVTRGELRKLGEQGAITAADIVSAFREARSELQERFGRTLPTVGQLFTRLGTNLSRVTDIVQRAALEFGNAANESEALLSRLERGLPVLETFLVGSARLAAQGVRGLQTAVGTRPPPAPPTVTPVARPSTGITEAFTSLPNASGVIEFFESLANSTDDAAAALARLAETGLAKAKAGFQELDQTLSEIEERRDIERLTAGIREQNSLLEAQIKGGERLVRIQQLLNAAQAEGIPITAGLEKEFAQLVDRNIELERAALAASMTLEAGFTRALQAIHDEAQNVAAAVEAVFGVLLNAAEDILVDLVQTGGQNFEQLADQALKQIQRIIIRLILVKVLSAALGGGGGGGEGAGAALGAAAARQGGGPVTPGRSFLVGERGPELFTPRQAGSVTNAQQTQAMVAEQKPPQITIVNEFDPQLINEHLNSGAADDVIVNRLSANSSRARGALR